MGLTDKRAYDEVVKLFNLCFDANSLCDRIAYILSINYNMVSFGDWFHHNIAHYFTGDALADGIEAFGELRGDLFYRGIVPEHKENYDTATDAIEAFTLKVVEIESQCVVAIKSCANFGAESYEDFLREMNVKSITPLLKQATVLSTQIKLYSEAGDLHKFNNDYNSWIISEFK